MKNLESLKGAKVLSKNEQKGVNGGLWLAGPWENIDECPWHMCPTFSGRCRAQYAGEVNCDGGPY